MDREEIQKRMKPSSITGPDGKELRYIPSIGWKCIYCGLMAMLVRFEDGTDAILHDAPECAEFTAMDPVCPEHAQEAVLLTARLMELTGKYSVSPILRSAAEKLDTGEYCCEFMKQQLTHSCETHGSKCPDVVIERSIFQGGEGKIHLVARNAEYSCNFCPSCGRKWVSR